jgi:hypothetical protein
MPESPDHGKFIRDYGDYGKVIRDRIEHLAKHGSKESRHPFAQLDDELTRDMQPHVPASSIRFQAIL